MFGDNFRDLKQEKEKKDDKSERDGAKIQKFNFKRIFHDFWEFPEFQIINWALFVKIPLYFSTLSQDKHRNAPEVIFPVFWIF